MEVLGLGFRVVAVALVCLFLKPFLWKAAAVRLVTPDSLRSPDEHEPHSGLV